MPQAPAVTVLSAPLAHTDRRALSEAWYHALHLAAPPPREPVAHASLAAGRAASGRRRPEPARAEARASRNSVAEPARFPREPARIAAGERRLAVTPFARRLARAVVLGARRPQPSACTIRTGGGRIVVLVRGDGARSRIVAVCTPALRERVERAVAHARFALAACGTRSEVA